MIRKPFILSCMVYANEPRVAALIEEKMAANPRQVVEVIDSLVVESHPDATRVPAGHGFGPIDIAGGVKIERLERELAERLLDASTLRGERWAPPTRQFSAVHAFVRAVWTQGDPEIGRLFEWDHDRRIWPVVQLSRLVRDNGIGTEHAVRRLIHRDGSETLIPFDGFETHVAFRLHPQTAGWLDLPEAAELASLMTAYDNGTQLPTRVRSGLRRSDSLTRDRYLESAMPVVVGALESLLKIGRDYAGAQFRQRVPALAAEVDIEITGDECAEIYADRSALVHGREVDLTDAAQLDDFGGRFVLLHEILRRSVRRAIEVRPFTAIFEDDARVRERWPTVVMDRGRERTI